MSTILGTHLSPFVRKVLIFANEAGIEINHRDDVMPFPKSDELLAANPLGKIPAMTDGDVNLGESSVICAYLNKKSGGSTLYPSDTADFGQALWWERYADTELVNAVGTVFFNRFVAPMMKMEPDHAAVEKALTEDQPRIFAFMNERLAGKEYAVGDSLSIADVALFAPFVNHVLAGETVDAEQYPEMHRYLQGLKARPAFAALLTKANTDIA